MDQFIINNRKEVSVILPAYNERENIGHVITATLKAFEDNHYDGEVLVIDDGSTDGTGARAEEYSRANPAVRIIHHSKNRGLTEALLSGFKNSCGDIVVFLCADLQSDPQKDIPRLVEQIKKGYDVVLGWRQGRREMKLLVSKIYHWFSKVLFGLSFHDMNWIKAFRAEVVNNMRLRYGWHRYIAILAANNGYKITEVKTSYYPRRYGKTKYGVSRIYKGFLDLISVKFYITFLNKPMHFFGLSSIVLIMAGVGLGLFLVMLFFVFHIQIRPAVLLVVLLILAGIQLFAIGLLSEMFIDLDDKLSDLRDEIRKHRSVR